MIDLSNQILSFIKKYNFNWRGVNVEFKDVKLDQDGQYYIFYVLAEGDEKQTFLAESLLSAVEERIEKVIQFFYPDESVAYEDSVIYNGKEFLKYSSVIMSDEIKKTIFFTLKSYLNIFEKKGLKFSIEKFRYGLTAAKDFIFSVDLKISGDQKSFPYQAVENAMREMCDDILLPKFLGDDGSEPTILFRINLKPGHF